MTKYVPPIAFKRLDAMIEALLRGSELDEAMRKEIAHALDCFFTTLLNERKAHTRGRRRVTKTWMQADLVRCLREQHNVTIKEAINAVLGPGVDDRLLKNRVGTNYRKLRSGKSPYPLYTQTESRLKFAVWYSQAVSRLRKKRNK